MATYTTYLNLEKPTTSETFNLLKMNQNWDKIDAGVSALNSNFNTQLSGARLKSCANKKGITITYSASVYGGILAIHNGLISSIILNGNSVSEVYSSGDPITNKTMDGQTVTLTMDSTWTHWLFIFYGDNASKIVDIAEVS